MVKATLLTIVSLLSDIKSNSFSTSNFGWCVKQTKIYSTMTVCINKVSLF